MKLMSRECQYRGPSSALWWAGVVLAAALPGTARSDDFGRYTLMGSFAAPSAGAFMDAFDVLPDGRVVVQAGNEVWLESAAGARAFERVAALSGRGAPVVFPAFVQASPDGSRIAVGNNADAVGVFRLRDLTGAWFSAAHFDADWLDDRRLAIRAGETVTLLDTRSDPDDPVNPVLIDQGPVAAGIALDGAGNLFTGNGFGNGGPSDTGWIKVFAEDRWRGVLRGEPVIHFEEEGTLVADLLSAASLGFDAEGNLHVGGGDFSTGDQDYAGLVSAAAVADAIAGRGPADPNDPADVRRFDPDENDPANWYDVRANQATSELLIRDAATSRVFVHAPPGGTSCKEVRRFQAHCRGGGVIRAKLRLTHGGHDGAFVYAAVDEVPFRSRLRGDRTVWRIKDSAPGDHAVALVDPASCVAPFIVRCP